MQKTVDFTDRDVEKPLLKANPEKYKTLMADIEHYKYLLRKNLPNKLVQKLDEAIEDLQMAGFFKNRLRTGDKAPDFTLMTSEGKLFSLSRALKDSPVVLSFFRGRWCGYDTRELQYQQRFHSKIKEHGARLISISPSLPEFLQEVKQEYNLTYDVLRDPSNQIAELFGIAYPLPEIVQSVYEAGELYIEKENGEESFMIPLPTTYVINQEGEIIFDFYHPDYTVRIEPREIVNFLKSNVEYDHVSLQANA